jgi:Ca2+-binding RTX toxin-like protein
LDLVSYRYEARAIIATLDNKPGDGIPRENDFIQGDVEYLQGGNGNDLLVGNNSSNKIYGYGGNDSIVGMNGNDSLYGDGGSDTLNGGNNNDVLDGGSGPDRLIGGKGTDTADYSGRGGAVFLSIDNIANDGAKKEFDKLDSDLEILLGGAGNDVISAGKFRVTINGGAGNDTIRGSNAADQIIGGAGLDVIFGNAGDDVFSILDTLIDTVDGGSGADSILVLAGVPQNDPGDVLISVP